VCDGSSKCATVDPLNGQYVTHAEGSLPFPILTNSTYKVSSEYAQDYISAAACGAVSNDYASVDRFARLACSLAAHPSTMDILEQAFANLATVSGIPSINGAGANDLTQWSIVYDLKRTAITYFTHQSPG
jgi:hypothetical protein